MYTFLGIYEYALDEYDRFSDVLSQYIEIGVSSGMFWLIEIFITIYSSILIQSYNVLLNTEAI